MSKQILRPKDVEGNIFDYQPRAFQQTIPERALPFARSQSEPPTASEFKLNTLVAENTGISELERKNFQAMVEEQVLMRLKAVQEKAYEEAHALGSADGHKEAFEEASAQIKQSLENLHSIVLSVSNIKRDLIVANESQIIKTTFHLAKALALKEIASSPESILPVLKQALENAASDEEITIRLNPHDAHFVDTVKGESGGPFERVSKLRVEVSESITPGGCVIETNYGVIDATIEQRVEKLWNVLEGKLPKVPTDSSNDR